MAVGLPYGFAFDSDKTGPMARLEAAMAERTFARWRGLLESQFLTKIKDIVLLDAASRGLIPDSEYLLDGRWSWPAKVSIDYGREARADIDLWKSGLKTAAQIYAENGEDYEEALRNRAKEAAMIRDLAQEYELQPIRISDSVPPTISDAYQEDEKPPLIESIGVGGAQSLSFLISQVAAGAISVEEAAVLLKAVFGMSDEAIAELLKASANKPEPEPIEQVQSDLEDGHKPTRGMIEEANRGLEWRKKFKRGGTAVGVARARDISNAKNLSDDTVKRMHSYFSRHEVDKKGKGFTPGEDGFPSAGRIAWALWGGDAGQTWAAAKTKRIAANEALEAMPRMKLERDKHGKVQTLSLAAAKEFVLPTQSAGESEQDFVSRCMADETMISEYPDSTQRAAVCYAQINNQ
jgi:hypothetical protein